MTDPVVAQASGGLAALLLDNVVVLPLVVALVTAIVTLGLRRFTVPQQTASVLGSVGYLLAVVLLWGEVLVDADRILTYQLSGWPAPYGISMVADDLSVLFLGLTAFVGLLALVYSVVFISAEGQRLSYHPLFHFMVVGVTGSFLTGDLFNLFVWFEVMLMSSYVLVVFYSGPEHTRAALFYTVINLVGGAVMLVAIGGLYATTGTLNMADMAGRLATADPATTAPVLGLSGVLFAVFALKSGIVPFQFWVPDAYRAAPAPVTAVLAGVVKKVGIYAIIRVYFTVFGGVGVETLPWGGDTFLDFFAPVFLLMAVASIVLGGLGAVGRDELEGLLAYSSVGQVGFIVLPLGIAAAVAPTGDVVGSVRWLGVLAAVVYSVNHGLAKSLLFLVAGVVDRSVGSVEFTDLGGIAEHQPVLAGSFFLGALALIGIPPLSGFFGKFLVFDTATRGGATVALAAALTGAVLTIAYFSLAWARAFWGEPTQAVKAARGDRSLVAVTVVLALAIVVLGVGFDPLYRAAGAAAEAALNTDGYVDAVLGGDA